MGRRYETHRSRAEFRRYVSPHDKIRIAYVSADFRDHPVAAQIVELFERHDRTRFETIAVSLSVK